MEKYAVSVIIPIYNMGKYLRECLDSIILQDLKDIEIIAVNDGSTDDSLEILHQYQKRQSNLVIFTQNNQGTGVARNVGLRNARGKYVVFMDPDDYYPNNCCLAALYNAAEEHHAQICSGVLIENNGGVCNRKFQIRVENRILDNCFIKTSEYDEIYGFTRYIYKTDFLHSRHICFLPYRRYEEEAFTVKALAEAGEFFVISSEVYVARAGYKRLSYSLEMCLDILRGIRDVYRVIEDYDLNKMYEKGLKNIAEEYVMPFYQYSYRGNREIDEVIDEINEITARWKKDGNRLITEERVELFRNECIHEYQDIKRLIEDKVPILIYGAGLNTKAFLDMLSLEYSNVIGIAVTRKAKVETEKMNHLAIRLIEEYVPVRKSTVVLVTAAPKYWQEIEKTLNSFRFQNVRYIDVRKLELAEALLYEKTMNR